MPQTHRLIRDTMKALRGEPTRQFGRVGLAKAAPPALDIAVSKPALARAIAIAAEVVRGVESMGGTVTIATPGPIGPRQRTSITRVTFDGHGCEMKIREGVRRSAERAQDRWGAYEYTHSGKLVLDIGGQTLKDGRRKIEERVGDIRRLVERTKTRQAQNTRAAKVWQAEYAARAEAAERRRAHLERMRQIEGQAAEFARAETLRRYLASVELALTQEGVFNIGGLPAAEYIALGKAYADEIDPLVPAVRHEEAGG